MNADKLKSYHEEELKDLEKYLEAANECPKFSQIFRKIAYDERHHAELIEFIINHLN